MNALLLAALIAVESGGDAAAIGDGGRSVGILQISAAVVEDVNRIAGTSYTLADRLNTTHAVRMCQIYLGHYATAKRLGRPVTDEDRARIWNGGPNGWRKAATVPYWAKVRAWMDSATHRHASVSAG